MPVCDDNEIYVCSCGREVERLRREVLRQNLEDGGADSQYVNTPSCQVLDQEGLMLQFMIEIRYYPDDQ